MIIKFEIKKEIATLRRLVSLLEGSGIFFYRYFLSFSCFRFYMSVSPIELALISDFLCLIGRAISISEDTQHIVSFGTLIIPDKKEKISSLYMLLKGFGLKGLLLVKIGDMPAIRAEHVSIVVENALIVIGGVRVERRS